MKLLGRLRRAFAVSSIDYGHWDKTNSGYATLSFILEEGKRRAGVNPLGGYNSNSMGVAKGFGFAFPWMNYKRSMDE